MRSAADQIEFHAAYQDRLRPIFLARPEQVLSSPRASHAHAPGATRTAGGNPHPDHHAVGATRADMGPQWRELAAQMAAMGVEVPPPTCTTDDVVPGSSTEHEPQRNAHPRRAPSDVVSHLDQIQSNAKAPRKSEVDTLLREVEAHLEWAEEEEKRASLNAAHRTRRGLSGSRGLNAPSQSDRGTAQRKAQSPPPSDRDSASHGSSSPSPDASSSYGLQDGKLSATPRTAHPKPFGAERDALLKKWAQDYAAWRDAYVNWYDSYGEAYRAYYGEDAAGPPLLTAPRTASPRPRPPRQKLTQCRDPAAAVNAEPAVTTRPRAVRGRQGGNVQSSRFDETSDNANREERVVHDGPVLYKPDRTPHRPAPLPPRSVSSSRATSASTATAASSSFRHALRTSSIAGDGTKNRPAWRH